MKMKTFRLLPILLFAVLPFFCLSCSSGQEDEDVISVTINNPSDYSISSLTVLWGTYDEDTEEFTLEGYKNIDSPEFPYKYKIKDYSKSTYYVIEAYDNTMTYFGYATVDTTDGGEIDVSITLELYDDTEEDTDLDYSSWTGPTTLAGGTDLATAVQLPNLKQWYTGSLAAEDDETWYKATVVAGTEYAFVLDDNYDGSNQYTSDVKVYITNSSGITLDTMDDGYVTPIYITATANVIYIKVVAEYDPGTYAIGIAEATGLSGSVFSAFVKIPSINKN